LGTFLNDLVFSLRTLRKHPAFAATAILTIGLGLGASAAIFSVVNAVLLRPMPYPDADRLVHVWPDLRNRNVRDFMSPPGDLYDLRQQTTAFDGLAGYSTGRVPITGDEGEPEQVPAAFVTVNFLQVMGARVARGRDFTEEDGAPLAPPPPGVAPTPVPPKVILTYEFWQRRFGGREDIVGGNVRVGNNQGEVVGILEPGFELLLPPDVQHERTPAMLSALRPNWFTGNRANVSLRTIGRLKAGTSMQEAQQQVDVVATDLRKRFATKESAGLHFRLERMYDDLVQDVRPAILVLMGAVTFVLLIACANVANLLLVRSAGRQRELAVRAALGGSRRRLVRQMLTESLVISVGGVLLGLLVAQAGIETLRQIGPATLPRLQTVTIDPIVVSFAAAAGVLSAVIFGVVPAFRASRPDVMDVLRAGGRTAGLATGRYLRSAVVVAEVALSLVLLIGAGLMVRSFVELTRIQPGFDPGGVMTFQMSNVGQLNTPQLRQTFLRTVQEALRALPGVQAVTAVSPMPLDGGGATGARWGTEEALSNPAAFHQGTVHFVLPGYFEAIGGRLIAGRTFTAEDNREDREVIVIDERLAAMAFPNQSPIGKRILARVRTDDPVWYEIIGVVGHQRHLSLSGPTREAIYFADGYMGHFAVNRWAVRSTVDSAAAAASIRDAIRKINPRIIITELQPMSAFIDRAMAPTRFALFLVSVFAAVAAVLAAVGLYGVLATTVRQRTSEIGVRIAFGAHSSSIFRLVLLQGLRLSAIGLVIGLVVAAATTGVMRSMLVGVAPTDPATFAAIAALFIAVAAIACWLPARRAARLDPITALREE
jgi:putative ABC transport system permease protein